MAADIPTIQLHRLSDDHSATATDEGATIYDTRADAPIAKVTLNNGEMWLLIEFYLDGYCPICGDSINQGHHLCSSCAAEESRIWAGYGY